MKITILIKIKIPPLKISGQTNETQNSNDDLNHQGKIWPVLSPHLYAKRPSLSQILLGTDTLCPRSSYTKRPTLPQISDPARERHHISELVIHHVHRRLLTLPQILLGTDTICP